FAVYAASQRSRESFGLNCGLAYVNSTRPFNAAAAPLVIRPQLPPSHLPGKRLLAKSKSFTICAMHSVVVLRGTEFASLSPTIGFCDSRTNGTPPYIRTNWKY